VKVSREKLPSVTSFFICRNQLQFITNEKTCYDSERGSIIM